MCSETPVAPPRPQSGAALVIGLLFLLLMSITTLEVSRSSILDQRMAGNAAVKGLSFERAERARQLAESRLGSLVLGMESGAGLDCSGLGTGFYARLGIGSNCTALDVSGLLWNEADSVSTGDGSGERYVVEYLGEDELFLPGTDVEVGGESDALTVHVFRVIARGSQSLGAATTIETRFAILGS